MFLTGFLKQAKANPVFVYRNIRKSKDSYTYSIKGKDGVQGHATDLVLTEPKIKVSEPGNARVRSEGVKNVHAGIQGYLAKKLDLSKFDWKPITYNPKEHKGFIYRDSGKPVDQPSVVRLTPMGALAGFLKEAFMKRMTKVVEHNKDHPDKQKNVRLTYKKLNGRTVKRKILPLSIKGNLVIAHDHKRDALRSFKIERIKHMEKAASFWDGFEKKANAWTHAAEVAGLGTLAAPTVASMAGKPMKEKNKNRAELAGLGVLAAPAIHGLFHEHFAKAFKGLKGF